MAERSPIVIPSSELDAELHDKAAKVVQAKNQRDVQPPSDHDDDLMTPPNVLLEAALQRAESLNEQKLSDDTAVEEWVRCVALSRIVYGTSHWLLGRAYVQLARAYLELKGLAEQALLHAKTARDMLASLDGQMEPRDKEEATLTLAVAYWVLGTAQTQLGSLNDAHRNLMEAKKYFNSHSKSSLPNVKLELDIATSIGRLCVKQNKPSNARDYFHKALDLSKAMFGPKSSELVPLLRELSAVELQCEEKKAAIELLREALDITQQEQCSEQTAQLLVSLARAHAKGGTGEDNVEDLLERASALYQSLGSPALAISCREELCHHLIESKANHERVIPILKEIITAKGATFGDYSQELADTLRLLGTLYLTLTDLPQARRYLLKAKSVYTQTVGVKHKDTVAVSQTLDLISRGPDSDAQNKPKFKTVV